MLITQCVSHGTVQRSATGVGAVGSWLRLKRCMGLAKCCTAADKEFVSGMQAARAVQQVTGQTLQNPVMCAVMGCINFQVLSQRIL